MFPTRCLSISPNKVNALISFEKSAPFVPATLLQAARLPRTLMVSLLPSPSPIPNTLRRAHSEMAFSRRHQAGSRGLLEILETVSSWHVYSQFLTPTHSQCPDFDVNNFPFMGDCSYLEYSVVDHLQDRYVRSQKAGAAAIARDKLKKAKYRDLALATNHRVFPASQECTGRRSPGYKHIFVLCVDHHDKVAFDLSAPRRTWASATIRQNYFQRVAICGFWSGSYLMSKNRDFLNQTASDRAAEAAMLAARFLPHPASAAAS